jgi:DeoR/GlpR family transcriptional regulator of sugar metabolism
MKENKYFVEERRKKIIDILTSKKNVKTSELADFFSVTEDLIRKDFSVLEKQDLIKKVYGGAILKTKMSEVTSYKERSEVDNFNFAKAAVKLIEDGDTIFIESSSFTAPILQLLGEFNELTIVTNGFLEETYTLNNSSQIIHTGGIVNGKDRSTYGRFALNCVKQFYFDKCFLSLAGVTKSWNITAAIEDSASLKQVAMEQSRESIMIISWDKFHHHGIYHVCPLEQIGTIISDVTEEEVVSKIFSLGIRLVQVEGG